MITPGILSRIAVWSAPVICLAGLCALAAAQEKPAESSARAETDTRPPAADTRLGARLGRSPEGIPVVLDVARRSPADRGGLREGDFVQQVNDREVRTLQELRDAVHALAENASASLVVWRDGEAKTLQVQLSGETTRQTADQFARRPWLGVTLVNAAGKGATVEHLYAGGPAEQAGLKVQDRIMAIGGEAVASATAANRRIRSLKPGEDIELTVAGTDAERTVTVKVGNLEQFQQLVFGEQYRRKFDDYRRFSSSDTDGIPESIELLSREETVSDRLLYEMLVELTRDVQNLRLRVEELERAIGARP